MKKLLDFMAQIGLCKEVVTTTKSRRGHRMCAIHILECIEKVEYIVTLDQKLENSILYDSVIRNLQTLAESTRYLKKDIRQQYANIPWKIIRWLRNNLVHGYLTIDTDEAVRRFINHDMIVLKNILEETYPTWRKERRNKRPFLSASITKQLV